MAKPISFKLAPWQHWRKFKSNEVALVTDNGSLTWQQLGERVNQQAQCFIGQKQPIVLLSDPQDHLDVLLTMLGAWQQGIATLLLNPQLKTDTLNAVLQHT